MRARFLFFIIIPLVTFLSVGCGKNSSSSDSQNQTAETPISVTVAGLENGARIHKEFYGETEELGTYASTGIPAVALTFDDGPQKNSTDAILDVLEEYDAHATFFIVSDNISNNSDVLKRQVELGCELGTHTSSHADLTTLDDEAFEEEVSGSISQIEEASGGEVTLIRPPYGSLNDEVKEKLELPIILWSIDTLDWKTRDASRTYKKVKNQVSEEGGDILLFHDIYDETASAIEKVVPWLVKKGYKLLTVSELYEYYEVDLSLHKAHGSAH
ncbi:MAG: polysaccharide deacetylase family protein [Lachnospiraceae bacterium]|nr:polysaccharide deacetylase family protein [Lachnospiraceae bacterium]